MVKRQCFEQLGPDRNFAVALEQAQAGEFFLLVGVEVLEPVIPVGGDEQDQVVDAAPRAVLVVPGASEHVDADAGRRHQPDIEIDEQILVGRQADFARCLGAVDPGERRRDVGHGEMKLRQRALVEFVFNLSYY